MQYLGAVAPHYSFKDWSLYLIGDKLHIAEGNLPLDIIDASSPAAQVIMELADPKFYPACEDCGDVEEKMYCKQCAWERFG